MHNPHHCGCAAKKQIPISKKREIAYNIDFSEAMWPIVKPSLATAARRTLQNKHFTPSMLPVLPPPPTTPTLASCPERSRWAAPLKSKFLSVEAFRAVHSAIESGKEPRKFLYETRFDGLFGNYRFDKNGDIVGVPLLLNRIKDGKPEKLS